MLFIYIENLTGRIEWFGLERLSKYQIHPGVTDTGKIYRIHPVVTGTGKIYRIHTGVTGTDKI